MKKNIMLPENIMRPRMRKKIGPEVRVMIIEPTRLPIICEDMKNVQKIEKYMPTEFGDEQRVVYSPYAVHSTAVPDPEMTFAR